MINFNVICCRRVALGWLLGFDYDTSSNLGKVLATKSGSASLYQLNACSWHTLVPSQCLLQILGMLSHHALCRHICQCIPQVSVHHLLSFSWCEASSLLALGHVGGSELCSARVQVYGSAGTGNKTSVWDYKIQLYSIEPTQRFFQSQILCRLYKVLQMKL